MRGAVGAGDRGRLELVHAPEPEAGAGLRGPDVRQRPAVVRDRDARAAVVVGRLQYLAWLERETELAHGRHRHGAEPAPERGGGGRGRGPHAQRGHERARPAARTPRPAAADAGAAAAGIETVEVYDLSRSASANSAAVANRSAGASRRRHHGRLDVARNRVALRQHRPRRLGHHPGHHRLAVLPVTAGRRSASGTHRAQGVDVRVRGDLALAHRLLGAHVWGVPSDMRARSSGCRRPCWRRARCRSRRRVPGRRAAGCSRAYVAVIPRSGGRSRAPRPPRW